MPGDLVTLLWISGGAAVASILGGLLALWHRPSTLFMSSALGFASGVLIATVAFEMMPKATVLASPGLTALGFVAGFCAVYALDLFVHHGRLAGMLSEQRRAVMLFYRRRRPRTGDAAVLAVGTSVEELIEGLAIGAGTAVDPRLGVLVALAIAIDNLSEGLSIGELFRAEERDQASATELLGWTSTIGIALFISSVAGWLLLRDVPDALLGSLFAVGAGAMFYLTVTDLLPRSEERHFQESSAIANGVGFLVMYLLAAMAP